MDQVLFQVGAVDDLAAFEFSLRRTERERVLESSCSLGDGSSAAVVGDGVGAVVGGEAVEGVDC